MPQEVKMVGDILRYTLTGLVTTKELQDMSAAGHAIERQFAVYPNRIADVSRLINIEAGYVSMIGLVDRRKKERFPNNFSTAVIAVSLVQFGLARMFKTLNDHPQIEIQIFDNEIDATSWLSEKAPLATPEFQAKVI
jgi:hypothetical protein